MKRTLSARDIFAARLTEFADNDAADAPEFVIPEDLAALSDEDLATLAEQAVAHFDSVYGDGTGLSDDDLSALGALTEGIETITAERATREQAAAERAEQAAALASRIRPEDTASVEGEDESTDEPSDEDAATTDEDEIDPATPVEVVEVIEAAARPRGAIRVPLPARRNASRPASAVPAVQASRMQDVVLAADGGAGLDWDGVGRAVDRRLAGFNGAQYAAAHKAGRAMREQVSVAVLRKPIPEDMTISSTDPQHVDEVMRRAMDESRLPGGSLVASGGWCAPSETLYTLCELESRDGLLSVPEIGIARGGISWTTGPDFADFYGGGFHYTEEEDAAGDYDGQGAGTKTCHTIDCPPFVEKRLDLIGLCINAGLLQQRGYPELIARTVRGHLVAHDHRVSAAAITAMVAGSTAVSMTAAQVGSVAPLLDSIELQVEHYRYIHRLSRSTTLEAVFPFWVHGAVRSDLARRQGVSLFDVSDAQIDSWFSLRGIAPQYVYDWQPLTGAAGSFKAWPTSVQFLLYTAGTWVRGTSDIITLDTIYDSVNLGTNDFTALFTEEGFLMAKMCQDSRVVTVPLSPTGMTGAGIALDADGTAAA